MTKDSWKDPDNPDEHWLPQWSERPRRGRVRSLDDTIITSIEKKARSVTDSRLFRSMVLPTLVVAGVGLGYSSLHTQLTNRCEGLPSREKLTCLVDADRTRLNYSGAAILLLAASVAYFYWKDKYYVRDFDAESTRLTVDAIIDAGRPR
jgi:hypothetical protein